MDEKTKKLVGCTMLAAIAFVMQLITALFPIKILMFNITIVTIPIAVAAIVYGRLGGTVVGAVFGMSVFLSCIIGLDTGGTLLLSVNPFYTFVITVVRTALAGFICAVIYRLSLKIIKNRFVSTIIASAFTVITNTGIFVIMLVLMFNPILHEWAGDQQAIVYIFTGLVGLNFLAELLITCLITPPICKAVFKSQRA